MSNRSGNGDSGRSRQIKATLAASAALFLGIFALMSVQMALGEDPAIGSARESSKTQPRQKAQGGGQPVLPPADTQQEQPRYADPREQYYDQPYGDGYYEQQAPPAYGQSQQYQQPGYQQPEQQYAPPVQSGPS